MIFGRFAPIPVIRPTPAQLGNSEGAPAEAIARPVILRNFLLVCLPIIAPLDYLLLTIVNNKSQIVNGEYM